MSKKNAAKTQSKIPTPKRVADVPVTVRHLELVKQELKSDITGIRLETASIRLETASIRKETGSLRLETGSIRKEIGGLRLEMQAGFKKLESDISQVKSAVFQMQALMEEQNSRNRVALDGYTVVYEKQLLSESRLKHLEKKVFGAGRE